MQGRPGDSRRQQPRLPVIAPRYEAAPPYLESSVAVPTLANGTDVPRTRLPPRSRSGCWTCRNRKVKCDEQRPTCGQCARLGHTCDYNPRLAFRDDTPRVLERMTGVQTAGHSIWDPSTPSPDYSVDRSAEDLLPAFSLLTNDEERERKAELSEPGTYVVVSNPSSFASLPEYAEEYSASLQTSMGMGGFSDPFHPIATSDIHPLTPIEDPDDPNVVILRTFEEPPRRFSLASSSAMTSLPTSFVRHSSLPENLGLIPVSSVAQIRLPMSLIEEARNGGRDAGLLLHYRTSISQHIIKVGSQEEDEDLFEIQARSFPPLFHAMMAISALSLAQRNGLQSTDALEHYQKVIAALQQAATQTSSSDGKFFTHYLLLLYEIGHAGPREQNMWEFHCQRLLDIITQRREGSRSQAHNFLVWMICLVDTYALLSGTGEGLFVQALVRDRLAPAPQQCLPSLDPRQDGIFFQDELPYFPAILQLNQEAVFLAVKVGEVARDLRADISQRQSSGPAPMESEHEHVISRQKRARILQSLLRMSSRTWEEKYPQFWPWLKERIEPHRPMGLLHHVYSLYHASVIYAHTSLYPGQMTERSLEYEPEVFNSIAHIFETARQVVLGGRGDLQHLTFSLFIAGYSATDVHQKNMAINLMAELEPNSLGTSTTAVRQALQAIYRKQHENINSTGYNLNIDWVTELRATGRGLIMFGL